MEARIYDTEILEELLLGMDNTIPEKEKKKIRSLYRLLERGYSLRVSLSFDSLHITVEHPEFERHIEVPLIPHDIDTWD